MKMKFLLKSNRMRHKNVMDKSRQIALVYRKMRISEQGSDLEYWLAQPPGARLAALEEIRREYHAWELGDEPRIEKVITVVRNFRTNPIWRD